MINLFYYYGIFVAVPFSTEWITFFCPTLCVTIIINAIKPYILIALRLIFYRCKIKERKRRFPMAKRDLQFSLLIWLVCTYGGAMPSLFMFAVISFSIQYVLDKILITYYYISEPYHDTEFIISSLKAIKYGVIPFLICGGLSQVGYFCSTFSEYSTKPYEYFRE